MEDTNITNPLERIFSIKYEPRHLDGIAGHEDARKRLSLMASSKELSHLLIAGPEGCGKLTLAKCFARDLLSEEVETSLSIIHVANPLTEEERNQARKQSYVSTSRIGSMAGKRFTWPKFIQIRVKPVVELQAMNSLGFKVLIVTDFHLLGPNQQGFRRLMELYGPNCRFILLTTQISSVIDPIKSRCQVILVNPVTKARFFKEIKGIGSNEGFNVNYTFINALYFVTRGNIGKALNYIQILLIKGEDLTEDTLFLLLKELHGNEILKFLESCFKLQFGQARELYYTLKRKNNYNLRDFLEELSKQAIYAPLSQTIKALLLDVIAKIDARIVTLASEEPHLLNLIFKIGAIV
ncbi:MAG: hypothetical protein ACFFCS_05135 [Candidatus Hodarchaeota archaeon]